MGPAPSRFGEILEQLRSEYEQQQTRNVEYEHKSRRPSQFLPANLLPRQRPTALTDCVVQQQIQEMEAIRHTVMTLEATHSAMKQKSVSLARSVEK